MKKFLVVGCGGSGGATLRYMIDQLKADLRPYGITDLPAAWQFLHIDVPPSPEETKGLGTIRELGGRYLSVSSPGNNYQLVASRVEQALGAKGALRELLGWAPAPKESVSVDVTKGAGQYRAVGRVLTLTDLGDILSELNRTWEQLQRPDAWGELPAKHPQGGPYETTADVIPLVVGSMAGGSGASMFLDVCRALGRLSGLNRTGLGVFLYTADVFASLPASQRAGVDGNALGALGEVIAAQTRASDAADAHVFEALGVPPEPIDQPAFARLFPIGSSIGGDGAKFGDGTPDGVYRGLGRALAATVSSEQATQQYIKSKVENPNPITVDRKSFGWGTSASVSAWGSFGYASLSLGRDRYAEYASQRMARNAFDRLVSGHIKPDSQLPGDEQPNPNNVQPRGRLARRDGAQRRDSVADRCARLRSQGGLGQRFGEEPRSNIGVRCWQAHAGEDARELGVHDFIELLVTWQLAVRLDVATDQPVEGVARHPLAGVLGVPIPPQAQAGYPKDPQALTEAVVPQPKDCRSMVIGLGFSTFDLMYCWVACSDDTGRGERTPQTAVDTIWRPVAELRASPPMEEPMGNSRANAAGRSARVAGQRLEHVSICRV